MAVGALASSECGNRSSLVVLTQIRDMPLTDENGNGSIAEQLAVEVSSTLSPEIMQKRSAHVNVLLRLSVMSGMQMQLESTLKMLCEFTREIVSFDRALVYFWNEAEEQSQLRVFERLNGPPPAEITGGNWRTFLKTYAAKGIDVDVIEDLDDQVKQILAFAMVYHAYAF